MERVSLENSFDLIAIGGGPASQKACITAAKLGKRVALIEKDSHLGGGCVHWGTIPSKSLQETSRFFRQLTASSIHGFETIQKKHISWKEMMHRASLVIEREEDVAREQMTEAGVKTVHGWGKLVDPHTVEVTTIDEKKKILKGEYILIATGSSPRRPENENIPFTEGLVFDSDGLFSVENIPRRIAIVGAGIIGCEYATIFAHIGIQVYLLDNADRILGFVDGEISKAMENYMKLSGIELHLNTTVEQYQIENGNKVILSTNKGKRLEVDQVLISRGRYGNVENIGLTELGISVTNRKTIPVNEHYQTTVPNIYAAGDVIGFPALASVSMYQGIYVARHIFGGEENKPLDAEELPLGVYTLPEVASIGPTEEALKERGIEYGVGKANFETITRSQISGDTWGILKLLYEKKTHKLLSVHIVSEKATELLALGQSVVNLGGTIDYFTEHVFNYPTMIGAYKNAAHDALSKK